MVIAIPPHATGPFLSFTAGLRIFCYLLFYYINRTCNTVNKKLIRRWHSERELSLRRHRTRTKIQ